MGLFNFSKSKCVKSTSDVSNEIITSFNNKISSVKILGSGCAKCNSLEEETKIALKRLNIDVEVEHVTDFAKIATYGVMSTPAIVVNEKVLVYGKVLKSAEIIKLITNME